MQKIQSAPDRRWAKDVAPGRRNQSAVPHRLGVAAASQERPFWRIELKDASGDLEARIWSPLSQQFAEIPSGVIAEVEGRAESFRDKLQVNVNALRVLSPEETASVDTSAFMASSSRPPQEMLDELEALCRKEFTYKPWRKFILSVLEDEAIRVPLLTAPAAKSVHHAWVGGLLEHTLSVATLCLRFCDHYPDLDRQTLLAGAICHDLGKIWEFSGGLANDYTDAGRLVGHINLCLGKLDRHLAKSGLDEELILHFQHLILSHHGCTNTVRRACRKRPKPSPCTTRTTSTPRSPRAGACSGNSKTAKAAGRPTRNRWSANCSRPPRPRKPNRASPALQSARRRNPKPQG